MDFEQAVKARRTIRTFSTREVPDELVHALIDCALRAPSSMDGQPWRFIIVRSSETKKSLAEIKNKYCPPEKREFPAGFLRNAPAVVLTCVERASSYDRGIENGVLATAHLLLAAANYGLTSVYMSAYKTGTPEVADEIRAILNIPADFEPITLVPIGYPGAEPGPKNIKTPDEVIFHETFGHK
jgi:nitroreductase